MNYIKVLGILCALCIVQGCVGVTEYEVITPDGVVVKVRNTKDYETYNLLAEKTLEGWIINLEETGVSASDPINAANALNATLVDKLVGFIK